MNASILIPVTAEEISGETVPTVSARDLHTFLEVGKDFTTWIKDRIEKYEFEEDVDYTLTFPKTGERNNVVMHEYHITLDMAKELSMVENNHKGKEARKYFIRMEKTAINQAIAATGRLRDEQNALMEELVATKDDHINALSKVISTQQELMDALKKLRPERKSNRKITQDELDSIYAYIKEGHSYNEAAMKFGRSKATCKFAVDRGMHNADGQL